MKKALIILTVLLLVAGFAMAAENSGNLKVRDAAQLNGKQLNPGDYKIQWDGNGPSVQVTVVAAKKTVMTTTGTVKELEKAAEKDSVIYRGANGKFDQIAEIHFAGKKTAIVFEGQPSPTN